MDFRTIYRTLLFPAVCAFVAQASNLARLVDPEASKSSPLAILNAGLWGLHGAAKPWYVGGGRENIQPGESNQISEQTASILHLPTTPLYNYRPQEHRGPRDQHYRQLIKDGRGQDGHMTHLMRVFGFLPPGQRKIVNTFSKSEQTRSTPKTFIPDLPPGGVRLREVCPFYADPLVGSSGSYEECNPREVSACPSGFLCDRSNLLGTHICCKDSLGPAFPLPATTPRPTTTPDPSPPFIVAQWAAWSPQTVWSAWAPVTRPTPPPYSPPRLPSTPPPRTTPPITPPSGSWGSWQPATWSVWQTIPTGSWTGWERVRTTPIPPPPPPPPRERPTLAPFLPIHPVPFGGNPKVRVTPLTTGSLIDYGRNEYDQETTVTLVEDGELKLLFDTGLPTNRKLILDGLAHRSLRPEDIDFVIISHGHPEHFGNQNLFPNQRQLFHTFEYTGKHFRKTELAQQPYRLLGQNTEIWKTPGHTQQDITLLIRNVPNLGTVAVVGDLIVNEKLYMSSNEVVYEGAWDVTTQRQNANMMICMADVVIPGHGRMFTVTEKHRIRANCPSSPAA